MPSSLRSAVPRPLKRLMTRLLGWGYFLRRRLRRLLGRGPGSPVLGRSVESPDAQIDAGLPANAPDSILARNEHGLYCVPNSSRHRPVAQAILQSRVWESETLDLVRGADSEGDIVHAGTFFGDFLPALARSRTGGAAVWAFEPARENYRCATVTIGLNDLQNVHLTPAGLGAAQGDALLATADREGLALGGASRIIADKARARWWEHEPIQLVSVDEVVGDDRRVAVMHLDVEGHEQEALAGAMRTIERCRPLIILETLPEPDWIAENLRPLGYTENGSVDMNHVLRCS